MTVLTFALMVHAVAFDPRLVGAECVCLSNSGQLCQIARIQSVDSIDIGHIPEIPVIVLRDVQRNPTTGKVSVVCQKSK